MASTHPHPTPRAALVLAVLAVLAVAASCSPDRMMAPASPPSFATATPIHQEPGIPAEETPLVPAPPGQCMYFDTVTPGTRWGGSVGTPKGQVVHRENKIRLSLTDYIIPSGTGRVAQYGDAVIDTVRYDVLSGHSLRPEGVGAVFDFRDTPEKRTAVSLHFVDRSPIENMAVDTSSIDIGQILTWRSPQGGHIVKVTPKTDPTSWPPRGIVTIYGKVDSVRVGGAKDGADGGLWLDFVCYHLPQGSLESPNPL